MKSHSESYKAAGVDITAGYEAVERMKRHVERTRTPGVLSGLGGFGGLFAPDLTGMRAPVFVSGTDGVGTKLKLAFLMNRHNTVGIDCVAMCVNDIICSGARPLFFLDYVAVGRNVPERVEAIVSGVAEGCVQAGCALIGGETAEMPGFYPEDEYDLAGFAVGVVDREKMLDSDSVRAGDAILALPSSGVHSNGFSLVRKALGDRLTEYGDMLLAPTKIYVRPVLALLEKVRVKSISHITGGGFYENIPRSLPEGLAAKIDGATLRPQPIFDVIQRAGDIPARDMFNTFNMGVGMSLIVAPEDVDESLRILRANGEQAFVCGEVTPGERGVAIC